MNMAFDAFQREVLAELGHVLYRVAEPAPAPMPDLDPGLPPLLRALCRAAGVVPAQLPARPTDAVMATAAGKRALWPQVRALRAGNLGRA